MKIKVVWKENGGIPSPATNPLGKSTIYSVKMKELQSLKEIRKGKRMNICTSINSNSYIYGACRHIPNFHKYACCPPSTDEGRSSKKCEREVPLNDITNIPDVKE